MNQGTIRTVLRWIHIVVAIPILGYIYSPFEKLPSYAPATRFVFLPIMVLSGLWMWKGHVVRRLISRRPACAALTLVPRVLVPQFDANLVLSVKSRVPQSFLIVE